MLYLSQNALFEGLFRSLMERQSETLDVDFSALSETEKVDALEFVVKQAGKAIPETITDTMEIPFVSATQPEQTDYIKAHPNLSALDLLSATIERKLDGVKYESASRKAKIFVLSKIESPSNIVSYNLCKDNLRDFAQFVLRKLKTESE